MSIWRTRTKDGRTTALGRQHGPIVLSFLDFIDDLGDECFEIARIATRYNALVGDHRLVDPVRAGVYHVCFDRLVRCRPPAAYSVRLDEQPWSMTDSCDDFAFRKESFDEFHR